MENSSSVFRKRLLLCISVCTASWTAFLVPAVFMDGTKTGAYLSAFLRSSRQCMEVYGVQYTLTALALALGTKAAQLKDRSAYQNTAFNILLCAAALSVMFPYFAYKTAGSGVHGYRWSPATLEKPFWVAVKDIALLLPSWFYVLLDRVYSDGWFIYTTAAFLFPIVLDFSREESLMYYGAILLTNPVWILMNFFLPVLSPFYVYGNEFFSYLPEGLFSLKQHLNSMQVTHLIQSGAQAVSRLSFPFQPIASFPSWHVGFVFFTWRFFKKTKSPLKHLSFAMFAAIFAGSILLGFHYLVDDIAGMAVWRGALALLSFKKNQIKGGEGYAQEVVQI